MIKFISTQFRYAIVYIVITFIALLFLNVHCSNISQQLFFNSKESAMVERCRLASSNIAQLEALNKKTVAQAVATYENLNVSRLVITDQTGKCIFDSDQRLTLVDKYVFFPEIIVALNGNDAFYCNYHDGAMRSNAAVPIYSYGTLIGCIYMMEYDTAQGTLIAALQNNIFIITLVLEFIVVIFSFIFAATYSQRIRKIISSIRTARKGDYTHKIDMSGHDELNALSDEFNDLVCRLQISEKKRSQFVSDASHELKTPLASIKLLTDSILQNNVDELTVKEFVGDIGDEADRLNRMSQKLLTLSRIEGQIDTVSEIIYLAPTIEKVVRMLSEMAGRNNIDIILALENDAPVLMLEDDLYQIIFNLIENGIKYNTQNGTLTITLDRDADTVIVHIRDTGMGIPCESLEHIFERFYRVDKARSRSTGGSGLGLSIVRNMVERNGGKIKVESTLGEGTAFSLYFPVFDTEEGEK